MATRAIKIIASTEDGEILDNITVKVRDGVSSLTVSEVLPKTTIIEQVGELGIGLGSSVESESAL